jgi:hypothetical protein
MFFYIIWLSNILLLSIPDEGYSRNASCYLRLINPVTFMCISQFRIWISSLICRVFSYVLISDYAFCWYWWNCWPSHSKLSFHNIYCLCLAHARKRFIIYRLIHDLFHISPGIIPRPPYQPETQSRVYMGRGMIAGIIFLSYASDKLLYEANKQNEIIKWI